MPLVKTAETTVADWHWFDLGPWTGRRQVTLLPVVLKAGMLRVHEGLAMFELRRERHCHAWLRRDDRGKLAPAEIWVDADVMEHENGFRLICLGETPPLKSVKFRYVKGDIAFDFYADRRHPRGTVTGTYSVAAEFKPGQMLGNDPWPVERMKIEAIAADIDAGLRAWPPAQVDETRPMGIVHFYFFTSVFSPARTDYRFEIGEPVALRDLPPSTRWGKKIVHHCVGRNRDGTDRFQDCLSLLREDGAQLIRIRTMKGPADDGPDTYRYVEQDIVFDFTADRRFSHLIVTDTWEVRLDPLRRDGLSAAKRAKLGTTRCAEIVRNIEEALYAWIPEPWEEFERQVPVNRVIFLDAP